MTTPKPKRIDTDRARALIDRMDTLWREPCGVEGCAHRGADRVDTSSSVLARSKQRARRGPRTAEPEAVGIAGSSSLDDRRPSGRSDATLR